MKETVNLYSQGSLDPEWFDRASKELNSNAEYKASKQKTGGGFLFQHELLMDADSLTRFRSRVNYFKRLAELAGSEFLTDDEDLNPYQYIYFQPGEDPVTVIVDPDSLDQHDELSIEYFHSPGWGSLSVENNLTSYQEERIKNICSAMIPSLELVRIESSIFEPYFQTARKEMAALENFEHFYVLRPSEKSTWYSKGEKAAFVVDTLLRFHREENMRVCVFPVNSMRIENIPGGSDSEQFCVLMENFAATKIIYKQRRKSW